jgi:hypothetical protein
MDDIAGVNDYLGWRIERVYVGNRQREVAHSLVGIGRIERQMRVGDLRDYHDATLKRSRHFGIML